MERVRDKLKEAIIRVQVVAALSKLAGSEDPSELDDDETSIVDTHPNATISIAEDIIVRSEEQH